jgi:hypothetical protein
LGHDEDRLRAGKVDGIWSDSSLPVPRAAFKEGIIVFSLLK